MKFDLVCTVKGSSEDGESTICDAFIFVRDRSLVGTKLYHHRDDVLIGEWEVLEHKPSSFTLKRLSGKDRLKQVDALYSEHVAPEVVVPPARMEYAYVFSGKNWRLATEKKWKEGRVEIPFDSPVVGEVSLRGKPYEVKKLPDGFAATPKVIPSGPQEPQQTP